MSYIFKGLLGASALIGVTQYYFKYVKPVKDFKTVSNKVCTNEITRADYAAYWNSLTQEKKNTLRTWMIKTRVAKRHYQELTTDDHIEAIKNKLGHETACLCADLQLGSTWDPTTGKVAWFKCQSRCCITEKP